MLCIIDKKGRVVGPLSSSDYEACWRRLRIPVRPLRGENAGAGVVRTAQQRDCWFRCDCLGTDPAPILVPVTETHVRRSPHHAEHADGCPFEMNAAERDSYAASLRELKAGEGFNLVRAIGRPGAALVREAGTGVDTKDAPETEDGEPTSRGVHSARRERSKLSQLLFKLLFDTRLHQVGRGPRGHADQQAALYNAARGISLGGDLMLSGVLYTDAGYLDDLIGRVRLRARWPDGRRPHGVMAFAAARIEDDVIVAVSGTRLTVEGPVAMFGPGHGRVRAGPFVVAVLVASPDGSAPLLPMRAYAHSCWSATDILPLDSSREARCFNILVSFQGWTAGQAYTVEITKPLYDRSRHFLGRDEPGQIVKPDFEGKIFAGDGRFLRSLVIEVLGLDTLVYREKKRRLRQILAKKPGHYLEHLADDGIGQAEGNRRFRQDLLRFGKTVIDKDQRRSAVALQQPVVAPSPPAPPPAQAMPRPLPVFAPSPIPSPIPAETVPVLLGAPASQVAVLDMAPATVAEPPLEQHSVLSWLAHRILTMLRGGR